MIQNIKVDIVYFMMATDFEFEFNLGGCCHMRLLNGKAKDKKEYLNALARAVSRSQIIISCGPIFGEEGLIYTTASAISRGLETVDNKVYGIASEDKIEVIEGAIPLVTPEGYFGGCIIESSTQTIILLTENRMIRKSIMKNLIHPYIEEMSLMQSSSGSAAGIKNIARSAEVQPESKDEEPEEAPVEENAPDNTEDEENLQAESFEEEPQEITEAEPAPAEDIPEPQYDFNENHEIDFDFSSDDNYEESIDGEIEPEEPSDEDMFVQEDGLYERKGSSKGMNISILIIALILLLAILGLCYFLIFLPMKNGISTTDYIRQLFDTASSTTSV